MAFTNGNKAFLQALIANPYIDVSEGKRIVAKIRTIEQKAPEPIAPENIPDKDVFAYISKATQVVTAYNMTIRDMLDQEDGTRIWALVNDADDEVIRFATLHSPDEILYFRRILDAIFDTYNSREAEIFAIKATQAINLNKNPQAEREIVTGGAREADGAAPEPTQYKSTGGPGLTKPEAQDALKKFYEESWLDKYEGFYFPSTRTLLELEVYLLETYNVADELEEGETPGPVVTRVRHCLACRYIHTIGLRCSNLDCDVRLHEHCVVKYLSGASNCPKCKTAWKSDCFVGPKAAVATDPVALRQGGVRKFMREFPRKESRGYHERNEDENAEREEDVRAERAFGGMGSDDEDEEMDGMQDDEEEVDATPARRPAKRQSISGAGSRGKRSRTSTMPLQDERGKEPDDDDEEEEEDGEEEEESEADEDEEEEEEEKEEEEVPVRQKKGLKKMKNLRLTSPGDEIDDIVLRRSTSSRR